MTEEKQKFIELLAESGAVRGLHRQEREKNTLLHQYRQTDVR